jgi:tripartite-type tricarboxylate transporter receptor subunit TctC
MMTDVLGKQIHAGIASVPDFIENQRADRVRVVAVLGSARQAALERFSNALAFQAQ